MPLKKHINPNSKPNNDTGFGVNPSNYGGRFINKDGSANIVRKGIKQHARISIFQKMIAMPLWEFLFLLLAFFITINLCFAGIYYLLGVKQVGAIAVQEPIATQLAHLFFFSAQTMTTVTTIGYTHVSLTGFWPSIISSFEALCGLLSFAILTGVFYARFARPKSFLLFSQNALVAPFKDKTALMFRFVSYKDKHNLIDVNIKVSLGLLVEENGKATYKYYQLPLERQRVDVLHMNLTIVHPIDENSPFSNFKPKDWANAEAELYVQVSGFDEIFSSNIVHQTSYLYDEIIYGAKFIPMYTESEDKMTTILDLSKLNIYESVEMK